MAFAAMWDRSLQCEEKNASSTNVKIVPEPMEKMKLNNVLWWNFDNANIDDATYKQWNTFCEQLVKLSRRLIVGMTSSQKSNPTI